MASGKIYNIMEVKYISEYNLITCIAQRGRKEDIVSAAIKSGANGITYFDATGTGTRQKLGINLTLLQKGER